ncbi:MAG TPA: SPOR domain-containing protein [Candidatus Limnocylindrales bacterium]|nr:SPOR domain-containing protein [Candidatus Limnocylindrales bacterium]
MRNNETGEFELVVGNRQLLSGFFIVVLLFAVGVALGYILGQNSEKSLKVADASSTIPAVPSQARPQPSSPPVEQVPAPAENAPQAAAPAPVETQPARDAAPASAEKPAEKPVEEPAAAPADVPEAAPGTYWQVMAVARGDADKVASTLRRSGFPAVLSPGTKGLTRVLVGPYADRAALSKAKTDLQAAGVPSPYRVEVGK